MQLDIQNYRYRDLFLYIQVFPYLGRYTAALNSHLGACTMVNMTLS